MTYQKPQVEVVKFDSEGFMTASPISYADATEAFMKNCTTVSGSTNNFTCGIFAGVSNPTQNQPVTIDGTTYVFVAVGAGGKKPHWKCQEV